MSDGQALAALSNPTRRALLESLARAPSSVGALAERLPVSRPAVSQHLRALKAAGLVADEMHGSRHIYRIDPHGLGALRAWLDQVWGEAFAAFEAEADRAREGRK